MGAEIELKPLVYSHRQCVSDSLAHLVEGDIVEVCYDPNDTLRKEHGHDVVVVLQERDSSTLTPHTPHTRTFMWRLQKMMSRISVSASSCGGVNILVSAENLILAGREGERFHYMITQAGDL